MANKCLYRLKEQLKWNLHFVYLKKHWQTSYQGAFPLMGHFFSSLLVPTVLGPHIVISQYYLAHSSGSRTVSRRCNGWWETTIHIVWKNDPCLVHVVINPSTSFFQNKSVSEFSQQESIHYLSRTCGTLFEVVFRCLVTYFAKYLREYYHNSVLYSHSSNPFLL